MDFIPENYIIGEKNIIPLNKVLRYNSKVDATCKILQDNIIGSGFFCKLKIKNKEMKFLFTNNHIINEKKLVNNSIITISHNNIIKKIEINANRFKCTNPELDYTCIEILDDDNIENYFEIDEKININNPEDEYKNDNLVIIQYPKGNEVSFAEGKINNIKDSIQVFHSASTEFGSSGSPLILSDSLHIIGIHCGMLKKNNLNRGIYFKSIIDDIEKQILNFKRKKIFLNEINGIYNIREIDLYKEIKILNYFIHSKGKDKRFENKNDFKNGIDLYIDNKKIDFNFNYVFNKIGKYNIKISFKKDKIIKNIRWMFKHCKQLISLDFSKFNSNNLNDINSLFYECTSLSSIQFLNFNTIKIEEMNNLFYNCSSLITLDLSCFNTINVIDMSFMFYKCSSLKNIILKNFNTEKVKDMSFMFCNCLSLQELDLSKFNTKNVVDMKYMFYNCSSIKSLNLKNFNTENVTDMCNMFNQCLSLKFLDISNFNFQHINDKNNIFNSINQSNCIIKLPKINKNKLKMISIFIVIIIPFIIIFFINIFGFKK